MSKLYLRYKRLHKWPAIFLSLFLLFFALSGIIMNHRDLLSSWDVKRNRLPKEYEYKNWNNAAVKGSVEIGNDSILIYGNIGIWLTNNSFSNFIDWNIGFPEGIDNRKISKTKITSDNQLFAGTMFGLFKYSKINRRWEKQRINSKSQRIVGIEEKGDSLIIVTRSEFLFAHKKDNYAHFKANELLAPENSQKKISLFRTMWVIHSGDILGNIGKFIVDIGGIAMILLSTTGLLFFLMPKWLRRIKYRIKLKKQIKNGIRKSYQWHLKVGGICAILLFAVAFTGMFLRPPMLIPIANKEIKPLRGTKLDNSNYWEDKLRDIIYDPNHKGFVISTSDGIYFQEENFTHRPLEYKLQPPISIMGINVLKPTNDGGFIIGSFSGIYYWNPYRFELNDYFTNEKYEKPKGFKSPFGEMAIAGHININNEEIIFEYNKGAITKSGKSISEMPNDIIKKSGMSIWNLALEIHTWRILRFLIGDLYILVVPIVGIFSILVIISGVAMWFIRHKRIKKGIQNQNQLKTKKQE